MSYQSADAKASRLFPYIALLTGIFIIWQIGVVMSCQTNFVIVPIMLEKHFHLPLSLLPNLLLFVFAQLFLYGVFVGIVWSVSVLFSSFWRFSSTQRWWCGIICWGLSIATILIWNVILFPQSLFSETVLYFFPEGLFVSLIYFLLKIILFIVVFAGIELVRKLFAANNTIKSIVFIFIVFSGISLFIFSKIDHVQSTTNQKPNIILIGLDAIRPNRIHYNGYVHNETPAIDHFLKQSTDFKLSLTPLARTYAAWVSILSGEYPKHNGVRFNLYTPKDFNFHNTLSSILQKQGYYTVYATDDTLFSHITPSFGFNKVIGIQQSADDFLLSVFNDLPLSNLITNTRLGEFLFPYGYGNRPASVTYDPDAFIHLISGRLSHLHHQPLFLAVHFCLTHWPYTWAATHATGNLSNSELYDLAVNRIDGQFNYFLKVLKEDGLLNNAVVVLLSDHGEAFSLPGDRLISSNTYIKGDAKDKNLLKDMVVVNGGIDKLNESNGHGTDVLSMTQYHNLLAFRGYGKEHNAVREISTMNSLVDIKPTILKLLNYKDNKSDGISLASYIEGKNISEKPRMIFVENGLSPNAINDNKISVQNVVLGGIDMFYVNPKNNELNMKKTAEQKLLHTKERAVFYNDWVLAYYPINEYALDVVLVNRKTGEWTDDFDTNFAKHSPVKQMMVAIKKFYGKELYS